MNCQHSYQDIAVKVIAHTKLGVFRQLDFSYSGGKGGKLNTPRFGKNYMSPRMMCGIILLGLFSISKFPTHF